MQFYGILLTIFKISLSECCMHTPTDDQIIVSEHSKTRLQNLASRGNDNISYYSFFVNNYHNNTSYDFLPL